jgi:hypothetical protein
MMANDLTEASLLTLLDSIRGEQLYARPAFVVVSQEGLDNMRALCADDAKFRKRVLAEFPQLEGTI